MPVNSGGRPTKTTDDSRTWIKIHRKLTKWGWYENSHMVHLFLHLLLRANHKPGAWKGHKIDRGQLITGRKKIHAETGISEQSIRTCLQRLAVSGEISLKSTSQFTLITILNYNEYQHQQPATNQRLTSDQPATNQRLTTNKNVKNNKEQKRKKEEIKKKPPDKKYLDFSSSFFEYLKTDHNGKNKPANGQIQSWAETIDKLVRLDNYNFENEIKPALRWAVKDEFWSKQVRSLGTLRSKSKNGSSKFQNIFDQFATKKDKTMNSMSRWE